MKNIIYLLLFISGSSMISCIGDDIIDDRVPEKISFANPIDSLKLGDTYTLRVDYFDNIGRKKNAQVDWSSSDESIVSVGTDGKINGIGMGNAIVTASVSGDDQVVKADLGIVVTQNETSEPVKLRKGSITTTSSYVLEGDFELEKSGDDIVLTLKSNFKTTDALPGLFVYLGNNPNSISSALEISAVTQFSGEHSYTIPNAGLFDYQNVLFWCKPFGVKVGQGDFDQ